MALSPDQWKKNWENLISDAQVRYKGKLKIRPKHDWYGFWTFVTWLLKIVTLGKGINLREEFYTTMGLTIWTPGDGTDWETMSDYHKFGLLSHELDHMDLNWFWDRDAQEYPWDYMLPDHWFLYLAAWWLRFMLSIEYFVCLLPWKYAYRRQMVEYYGYKRTLEAHLVQHDGEEGEEIRPWILNHFIGSNYNWMATEKRGLELVDKMFASAKRRYKQGKLDHLKG